MSPNPKTIKESNELQQALWDQLGSLVKQMGDPWVGLAVHQIAEAFEAGVNDLLSWPLNGRDLKARVRSLLKYGNAIKELRVSKDRLEARVKERTQALVDTNQALEREVAERRVAEQKFRTKNQVLENAIEGIARTGRLDDGPLQAVRHGCAAAGISVTRPGTALSMLTFAEVEA